jgi:hypothetical protein
MKGPERLVLSLLVFAAILFACVLFWPFLLENILKPLSLTGWLLLRIFLLSISQATIWGILIVAAILFFAFRFLLSGSAEAEYGTRPANSTLTNLEFWRTSMSVRPYYPDKIIDLRKKMIQVLVSIYASRKRIPPNFTVLEAFQQGDIPLPPAVHAFLFAVEKKEPWRAFPDWLKRISGREASEHYHNLEQCLNFLDNFMEVKDERNAIEKDHN